MNIRFFILAGLFAAVVSILAQISIPLPFSPVPITGQVFGVFLAGALLGSKGGAVSLVVYLLLGAAGAPVFANAQGGLQVILGPTGGYLLGFILGAYLLGKVVEKGFNTTYWRMTCGMFLCMAAYYSIGSLYLAAVAGLSLHQAVVAGVIPFIAPDLLKLFVAAGMSLSIRRVLERTGLFPPAKPAKEGVK